MSRFDLEDVIRDWKRSLRRHTAFEDGDVAELESHLRETIRQLVEGGHSEEEAFHHAAEQIGDPAALGNELRKSRTKGRTSRLPRFRESRIFHLLPNYLKVAFRNASRDRSYTLINVSGLTLAMAAFMIIAVYIFDQTGYDRFHEKADRIHRITYEIESNGRTEHYATSVLGLAPVLNRHPDLVKNTVRLSLPREMTVEADGASILVEQFHHADSTFFEVFDFPLSQKAEGKVLARPNTAVITHETADRLFGSDNDPLGQTITVHYGSEFEEVLEVTGIAENVTGSSHFSFQVLASLETLKNVYQLNDRNWWMRSVYTYAVLQPSASVPRLQELLSQAVDQNMAAMAERSGSAYRFHPQRLTEIHLHSHLLQELQANGNIQMVYLFAGIAGLILLVGCVNYFNLATARSGRRHMEVGIRKTLGANRGQLIRQFYIESMLVSTAAVALAWVLLRLWWTEITGWIGLSLSSALLSDPLFLLVLLVTGLGVGLLAGSYPAVFLSHFSPSVIISGRSERGWSDSLLRKGLVVFQFAVTSVLIVLLIVIHQQLDYVFRSDPGFQKEQVMVLQIPDSMQDRFNPDLYRKELSAISGVEQVAFGSHIPTRVLSNNTMVIPETGSASEPRSITVNRVDPAFMEVLDIPLAAGRNFTAGREADTAAFILNEAAVRYFGWTGALDKTLHNPGSGEPMGRVIGVARNFHVKSFQEEIEPMLFRVGMPWEFNHILVSFRTGDTGRLIGDLRASWSTLGGEGPLEYAFLDEQYEELYTSELQLSRVLAGFTLLGMVIGCMGLFGLASYAAHARTREIGIRKVLGAGTGSIVRLLSRDLLMMIAAGFLIALPVSYLLSEWWLQGYAYRTEVEWWIFAASGGAVLVTGFLTVGFKTLQAALVDPVESLGTE